VSRSAATLKAFVAAYGEAALTDPDIALKDTGLTIHGSAFWWKRTMYSGSRSPHSRFSTGYSNVDQVLHKGDRHLAEDSEVTAQTLTRLDRQRDQAGARRYDYTGSQGHPVLR
jgi:hypothetical protein